MDPLLQREEKHGPCRLVWIGVLGVTCHADDLKRARISRAVHAKVFADRIFVGKVFPDERFIHNRHWTRGAGIGLGEIAPAHDALSDCRKVPTAHPVPGDTLRHISLWVASPFYRNQLTPVIAAEWTVGRQ